MKIRCPWARHSPEETRYHDTEWGVPHRDDRALFELLVLEGAQAGLSWQTVLKKREGYRRNFAGFDPEAVAAYTASDVDRIIADPGIIRHRRKIESAISNARHFLDIAARHGSFSGWLWDFVEGTPIQNAWTDISQIPASTPLSQKLAAELKKRGFSFLGPTTVYAFMQASGMVNDHLVSCFRYPAIIKG